METETMRRGLFYFVLLFNQHGSKKFINRRTLGRACQSYFGLSTRDLKQYEIIFMAI